MQHDLYHDTWECPACGTVVKDELMLCPECEQDDAEWRQEDWVSNVVKAQRRGWDDE